MTEIVDSEYGELAEWAFLRPGSVIQSPAITRHVGYWVSDLRGNIFDDFVKRLKESGFELGVQSGVGDAKELERHNRTQPMHKSWRSLPVQMTVGLHREYLTVSIAITLAKALAMPRDRGATYEGDAVFDLLDAVRTANRILFDRYKSLDSQGGARDNKRMNGVRQQLEGEYGAIFISFWNGFHAAVLNEPIQNMKAEFRKFLDFRGFIVNRAGQSQNQSEKDGAQRREQQLFTEVAPETQRTQASATFKHNEDVRLAYTILPFMTAEHGEHQYPERQLSVSCLLDRRCIYASMVGAKVLTRDPDGVHPITHFALTTGIGSWQLGRLVDNLQTLGTMRLAGRRFLRELTAAGEHLHALEGRISEIEKKIPSTIGNDEQQTNEFIAKLSNASDQLMTIRVGEEEEKIPGGLPYRVERSRYYQNQFKTLAPALRIRRVEGFQPYDLFVTRRFGGAYEFIDMVGKRYERIERQLSGLYQRVRIAETISLLGHTKRAAESTEKSQIETRRATESIEILQRAAERGFWWVIFPYYFSTILVYLTSPLLANLFSRYFAQSENRLHLAMLGVCYGGRALYLALVKSARRESPYRSTFS